ncbi:MAG: glutamine amidotransferase [Eudoraea sp.]|nr:glutamine amidotransferase [Eudoraea sp.]MBT8210105.1 glutamine amidotransferase [Eudoraea sp.]MBT8223523.1 glutamine amidotransferase [Eudoraea sp.]
MKKLLILQMRPEDVTAKSEYEAILRVSGLPREEVHLVRLEQGIPNIDLSNYTAIIAGGSPFDISKAQNEKSQTQKDIEAFYQRLFDRIVPADFPFLGCCSGNGLLGHYCGTPISEKYSEPIGTVEIRITEEGARDPLLKGLPPAFTARVGHKEACDGVPANAVLLATSDPCPVQMFRIGQHIYATQFHPEADAREFILRVHTYKNYGYFDPEEAEGLIDKIKQVKTHIPKEILKRFVRFYHRPSK